MKQLLNNYNMQEVMAAFTIPDKPVHFRFDLGENINICYTLNKVKNAIVMKRALAKTSKRERSSKYYYLLCDDTSINGWYPDDYVITPGRRINESKLLFEAIEQ